MTTEAEFNERRWKECAADYARERELRQKLQAYTVHRSDCNKHKHIDYACTCGLSNLITPGSSGA